jgi:hypothetical protein
VLLARSKTERLKKSFLTNETHIIAESEKWTHKPSESCKRDQSKNVVRFSFLRTDILSSQYSRRRATSHGIEASIMLSCWQETRSNGAQPTGLPTVSIKVIEV